MTHHVKVRKLRHHNLMWYWDCSCGKSYEASTWRLAFDWAFDHASFSSPESSADPQDPVDLLPLVKTKLAWDILDHADMNAWLPRLGLVPAAKDMDELEHAEAHLRAAKVVPVANLAETYAAVIADIQTAFFAHESGNTGDTGEFTDMMFRVVRSGVFAILGEFFADGVIDYGPALTGVKA